MNQQFLRKIKQMQQEMVDAQQEIEQTDFVASAGGVVTVTLKGNKQIQKVEITKGFTIDGEEDVEMLNDMIVAACNQAYREIEKMTEEKLGKYQAMLGGMGNLF
jgi:DNA-binding YbaB/EbfC family protein